MSLIIPILITAGVAIASVFVVTPNTNTSNQQNAVIQNAALQKNENVVEYKIQFGDTFTSAAEKLGIPEPDVAAIVAAAKDIYDFTKIRAGRLLKLVTIDNAFASVQYDIDGAVSIVVEKNGPDLVAKEVPIQYDIRRTTVGSSITSSLFADASQAGLEAKTILELADIFAWDIDFASDIKMGDLFKIVYEKRSRDGKPAGVGRILAARFENQGQTYWAMFYKDADGKEQYYDLDGKALSRQFLKSPLNYSYISSGFTYNREHPVLKTVLPHRAIDYAAQAGTPVVATADGEVVYAGWKGGNGIYVEIKHNGTYSTQYAHFSKLGDGIKKGVRVKQNQVIGYVGSTGLSTGAHLQYAMAQNGTPVNPLTADLPAGESVKKNERDDFRKMRDELKKSLE